MFALGHLSPQVPASAGQGRAIPSGTFRALLLAGVAGGLIGATTASAADATWAGGVRNWDVGSNWVGGVAPATGDNVFIDGGNPATSVVSVNISPTVNNVTISAGDTLAVIDGIQLSITGNVANSGTHALNGSGAATVLRIGPNTTLAGTGTLALSDSTAN
jgi:hypothetical protein